MEVWIPSIIMGIAYLIGIGMFGGLVKSELKNLKENICRLEIKQDKHNSLMERMAIVEQKTSSAHKRIDDHSEAVRSR